MTWLPNSRVWIGWRHSSAIGSRSACCLFLRSTAATSAWQQGTSTIARAPFFSAKRMASSVAVLQACSAVTMSMRAGSRSEVIDSATVRL